MPIQAPQWTEFLSCPICYNVFGETHNRPISLGCGHTICKVCLGKIEQKKCPFDQNVISREIDELPVNFALLQLVGVAIPESAEATPPQAADTLAENYTYYKSAKRLIEDLAMHLKPVSQPMGGQPAAQASLMLSRPLQRKLVTLVNCQLLEEEGRARLLRAARSLGERTVTELILQHQNPQQLSANLWAAVRARGCQFLGPAMQEEVLKLVLLALEDGSALSRKVLVLFAVQRLESQYTQASKTAVGHVVQLLYRASCFKVTKREEESSLMQLKDEFRTYEALRREHDSQIVQIATEAGLRISPEQWSSLLYGDATHKSYMQSIIDKLQTPQSFSQSVSELMLALQRTNDPGVLSRLKPHFDLLANIDPSPDIPAPSWENLDAVMQSVHTVVEGLIEFIHARNSGKTDPIAHHNTKFKTSMCRDLVQKGRCPRGTTCTFAHSQEEMERFRNQNKKFGIKKPKAASVTSGGVGAEDDDTADCQSGLSKFDCALTSLLISRTSTVTQPTRENVTVPVGKPSVMPMQARKAISQQTIYTSPTHARDEPYNPPLVPTCQRAPPPHIVYKNDGRIPASEGSTNIPRQVAPLPKSSSATASQMLCLPPNPYMVGSRINIPTSDSHYYLTGNLAAATRGKSPSQQLEELQRRKKELITQLNESQNPAPLFLPGETSKDTEETPPPVQPLSSAALESDMMKSLADSMATAISTMAIQGEFRKQWPDIPADMCPPEAHRKLYNSLVASQPIALSVGATSVTSAMGIPESRHNYDVTPPKYQQPSAEEPPFVFGAEYFVQDMAGNNCKLWVSEDEDEFIPFEHTVVSKYGPISRMARVKVKNTHPVQVQAVQGKDTTPVTVMTPLNRPYPVSYQVPSRFDLGNYADQHTMESKTEFPAQGDQSVRPKGLYVATSLPTALMHPNLVTAGATIQPNTLLRLKEKVLNLPNVALQTAKSCTDKDKVRTELEKLNDKIENLKMSEDERLARELQAVELNIRETQRQVKLDEKLSEKSSFKDGQEPLHLASAAQAKAARAAERRRAQEQEDRKLAEKLVLEEAREMYG